jgi:hypothetical protein
MEVLPQGGLDFIRMDIKVLLMEHFQSHILQAFIHHNHLNLMPGPQTGSRPRETQGIEPILATNRSIQSHRS